ncbi:MAG: cell wall hydrolase [Pirellulaceae bacterium]
MPETEDKKVVDVIARTIWAEARGEGRAGMEAVACVIRNRANHPRWWGSDYSSVCLKPNQFSCWNATDPNLPKLRAVTSADSQFALALEIASAVVDGTLSDPTRAVDRYFAATIAAPSWAAEDKFVRQIGNHKFYRLELTA